MSASRKIFLVLITTFVTTLGVCNYAFSSPKVTVETDGDSGYTKIRIDEGNRPKPKPKPMPKPSYIPESEQSTDAKWQKYDEMTITPNDVMEMDRILFLTD